MTTTVSENTQRLIDAGKTVMTGNETYDEFKEKIVVIAMEACKEYGWCDEIRRIVKDRFLLGEYLPVRYVVQRLYEDEGAEWVALTEGVELAQAVEDAEHRSSRNLRHLAYNLTILPGEDVERIVERAKAQQQSLNEQIATYSEFPKFRVVSETDDSVVVFEKNSRNETTVDNRPKEDVK